MNIQFYFVLGFFQHSHKGNAIPTMNCPKVKGWEMLCEYIFSFVADSWARNVSCSFKFHVITLAEPFQYWFPLLYLQFIQLVCFLEQCCQYLECSSSTTYRNCVFSTILLTHRWREHHTGWLPYINELASHHRASGSIPGNFVWDSWRMKQRWSKFFCVFGFPILFINVLSSI